MNFSEIKPKVYLYLGYKGEIAASSTDSDIERELAELERIGGFKYLCRAYSEPPEFLHKSPYSEFLDGSRGVVLCVTTLGHGVDSYIKKLSRTDASRALVADSCASATLEYLADEYERGLSDELTYRFCPGYGGSDVSDIRYIFRELRPERIGVTVDPNYYMLPSKTMAGVIGIGKRAVKTCEGCLIGADCKYLKENIRCYDSAKK